MLNFNSVEKTGKILTDWLELSRIIWDYMHDEMKYDQNLIDSMTYVTDFFRHRYNDAIKFNDHGNYFDIKVIDILNED